MLDGVDHNDTSRVNGGGPAALTAKQVAAEARRKGWENIKVTRLADSEDPDSWSVVAGEYITVFPGKGVADTVMFRFDRGALEYHFRGPEEHVGSDQIYSLITARRGDDYRGLPATGQAIAVIFKDSARSLCEEADELECAAEIGREQAQELARVAAFFEQPKYRPHL